MFGDWSDPYDVDNYSNEVEMLYKNVPTMPSSKIMQLPSQVIKDTFEVQELRPNDLLPEGNSIGSQPKKNILESGPIEGFMSYVNNSDHLWIILIVVVMILYIIVLKFQLATCQATLQMFMLMNKHKIENNN